MVDVQVHGAGLVGLTIAAGLRDAGVHVRVVDPAGAFGGASGRCGAVVLGAHPEHPWRFEAALGTPSAAAILGFVHENLARLDPFDRCGVDWIAGPGEEEEVARSLAAADRIGLRVDRTDLGFRLLDAGRHVPRPAAFEVHPDPVAAEIDVFATGAGAADPWLADKLMPVRWQSAPVPGLVLPRPRVSRLASVFADTGHLFGARWATPHLEVGETDPTPGPRVAAVLARLADQDFHLPTADGAAGIVAESCDGLPIVGPVPGRPRVVVCAGFGISGLTYGLAAAASVVDGILGRAGFVVPPPLRSSRFR